MIDLKKKINIFSQKDDVELKDSAERETRDIEAKKFETVLKASRRVLFRAKGVFPFDFFPDEIVIDENKVDIIHGIFFYSRDVFSVPFSRITGAASTTGLFFGSIHLELDGYAKDPSPVTFLFNRDAAKARRIINGLVAANRQNIDLSKLPLSELIHKIEEIGISSTPH